MKLRQKCKLSSKSNWTMLLPVQMLTVMCRCLREKLIYLSRLISIGKTTILLLMTTSTITQEIDEYLSTANNWFIKQVRLTPKEVMKDLAIAFDIG